MDQKRGSHPFGAGLGGASGQKSGMDVGPLRAQLPIAAVVIGRNEGARLGPSLRSVQQAGLPLIYVDSGSRDASVELAQAANVPVVQLDPGRSFSAGRARNEGVIEVLRRWPTTDFVQFPVNRKRVIIDPPRGPLPGTQRQR